MQIAKRTATGPDLANQNPGLSYGDKNGVVSKSGKETSISITSKNTTVAEEVSEDQGRTDFGMTLQRSREIDNTKWSAAMSSTPVVSSKTSKAISWALFMGLTSSIHRIYEPFLLFYFQTDLEPLGPRNLT